MTATDVSPSALGRARERAGDLPMLFVLDDVTAPRLDGAFDVAVDCGLLHCLPPATWPAYAKTLTDRVAPGGALLLVSHRPGSELATTAVCEEALRTLLPAFDLIQIAHDAVTQPGAPVRARAPCGVRKELM